MMKTSRIVLTINSTKMKNMVLGRYRGSPVEEIPPSILIKCIVNFLKNFLGDFFSYPAVPALIPLIISTFIAEN